MCIIFSLSDGRSQRTSFILRNSTKHQTVRYGRLRRRYLPTLSNHQSTSLLLVVTGGGPGGGALLGDAAGGALAVGGVGGEVNVLLRRSADVEAGDVDELVADADVTLADEDAGVVDGLGEALLVDLGLKTTLEELLGGELEDGIEIELVVGQQAVARHATEEGGTLEDALGILGIERQEGTGGLAELGQGVLDAPDLALAAEAVLTDELELGVEALLLVGTAGRLEGLAVCKLIREEGDRKDVYT